MARRPTPPQLQSANLSYDQMEAAMPKIDRRIADLRAFDSASMQSRRDPGLSALENKLEAFLTDLYGVGSVEYNRYHYSVSTLDREGLYINRDIPIERIRDSVRRAIEDAITQLTSIKEGFVEELEDAGRSQSKKPLRAYEGLDLHPVIEAMAGSLYRDGHYSNAIEAAVKALNELVRGKSGITDKDGSNLMEAVFNPSTPILKFNGLADQSDKDEQRGFMMMFSGAVAGLRNPRAHKFIQDDAERALEFIAFVSLLAKLLDRSKK
jgi:uncharacterized protein (TIGR02391 family)